MAWTRFFRRSKWDQERLRELESYVEDETQDNIARGMPWDEARYAAQRKLGNPTLIREEIFHMNSIGWLETIWQDIRFGARLLRRNPGFSAIAILTLAIGIGSNTAIFSIVNAVLLRPLPYAHPENLVMIWQALPQRGFATVPVSEPDFAEFKNQSRSFSDLAAVFLDKEDYNLTGSGTPERVAGMNVSANLFSFLGVKPALGRSFLPDEDQPGHEHVVVLSHRLWQRKFGGDPGVLSKAVTIDGQSYTVVGVMPAQFQFPPPTTLGRFTFPSDREMWLPLVLDRPTRANHPLEVFARLKPSVGLSEARAEIDTIAASLAKEFPGTNDGVGGSVLALSNVVVQNSRALLMMLFGIVSFILLIACANVANLLLARATARSRELSVRAALGASRGRLARQAISESAVVALLGGAAGVLLARWGLGLLRAAQGVDLPRLAEVKMDARVAAFAVGVTLLSGWLFGLAPAWLASRADVNECLKQGSRSLAGGWSGRVRGPLIVAEVALALMPMIAAGLLIRSFTKLLAVDPGFDAQNLLTANLRLSHLRYPKDDRITAFTEQVLDRIRALPGVGSASTVNSLPITGFQGASALFIEGRPDPRSIADTPLADERVVSSDYFRTMRIPILSGRAISDQDGRESAKVAVINGSAARRYFSGVDPLGKRLKVDSKNDSWRVIVGVAGDVHQSGLAQDPDAEIYLPQSQEAWSVMTIVVRGASDVQSLASAVRDQVWAIDKEQPVFNIKSMDQILAESLASRKFTLWLLGGFAGIALLLAAIGIYGVISYSVTQRTREIGIRVAIGARPADVFWLVVGQGMLLSLVGIAIGLAGALALSRVMSSLLFGIGATDVSTLVVSTMMVFVVGVLASYIPARRAVRVDPMVALRYE